LSGTLATGNAVKYFNGGGSNLGGLTDGTMYFVGVDAGDPNHVKVQLFHSRNDALHRTGAIAISKDMVMGTTHRLVKQEDQGTITVTSPVMLNATSTNDATIKAINLDVGAVKIKAVSPEISTGGSTQVHVGGKYTFNAPSVNGQAMSTNSPHWDSLNISLSAVGIDVVSEKVTATHETDAFVGRAATIAENGGGITLGATSVNQPKLEKFDITLSAVGITDFEPDVEAGGATKAYVDQGAAVAAGSLSVTAMSNNTPELDMSAIGLAVVDVKNTEPTAKTTHTTEAYIGPGGNVAPDANLAGSISVGSPITVMAKSQNTATIDAFSLTFGAVTVHASTPDIDAGGSTLAHVGGKFTAINQTVNATADSTNTANGKALAITVGAIPVGFDGSSAKTTQTTDAYVSQQADVTFTGGAALSLGAISHSMANSGETSIDVGAVPINVAKPHAEIDDKTRSYVDQNAKVSAGGVSLSAEGHGDAKVKAVQFAAGVVSIGVVNPVVTTNHEVDAYTAAGSNVQAGGGAVTLTAMSGGSASATANGTDLSVVASVSSMAPTATNSAKTSAYVGGKVSSGTLQASATSTEDASASISVLSIAIGGGGSSGTAEADTNGDTTAYLDSGADVTATGTVEVDATSTPTAEASAKGGGGGVIAGVGSLSATDKVQGSTNAYLDTGAKVEQVGALKVSATTTSAGSAQALVGTGGAFSAGGAEAHSTLTPTTQAYIGQGVQVQHATGTVMIEALSVRAESHAQAQAYGGGIVQIGHATANATSDPTVKAYTLKDSTIKADGDVIISAQSHADKAPDVVLDDFIDGVDTGNGTINFPNHGLSDGQPVVYQQGSATTPIQTPNGDLTSGRQFGALAFDKDDIRLGAAFDAKMASTGGFENTAFGIDTGRRTIKFPTPHQLVTGDAVKYDNLGQSSIGLDTSKTYYVRVLDPQTIQLFDMKADAIAGGVDIPVSPAAASAIEGDNQTVDTSKALATGETFTNGEAITYQAQAPVLFSTTRVDVAYQTLAGIIIPFGDGQALHDDSTKNNIFLGQDTNGDGIPDVGHNFQTGDEVIYHTDNSTLSLIGGLMNDTPYWVIRIDKWSIQLAHSPSDAIHTDLMGHPDKFITLMPNKTTSSDPTMDATLVQQFLHVNPLGALQDGETYFVKLKSSTEFQLFPDATLTGTPLDLSTGQTGGVHHFHMAGIAINSSSGTQQIYLALTGRGSGTSPNPSESGETGDKLLGPNNVSLRLISPPAGDGISQSTASGGGGGVFATGSPSAETDVDPTVKAFVAALISANGKVTISSQSVGHSSSSADNGSGGLIATGSSHAKTVFHNTNQAIVGDESLNGADVQIQAGHGFALTADSQLDTSASSDSEGGGLFAHADATSTTDVDNGGTKTTAVVGANAQVQAQSINVTAGYSSLSVNSSSHASAGGLTGGTDATTNGNVDPTAEVDVNGGAGAATSVSGSAGVDLRALNQNVNVGQHPDAHFFGIGSGDNHNDLNQGPSATIQTDTGVTITAGPRIFPGPGVPAQDETPLQKPAGFNTLALFAAIDSPGSQNIHWKANVVILSGPSPTLVVNEAGKIEKAINASIAGVGSAIDSPVDPGSTGSFTVSPIMNTNPGQVDFTTTGGSGTIDGSGSTWTFIDTYPQVTLINRSKKTMDVSGISVVDTTVDPTVNLDETSTPPLRFNIVRTVAPTNIDIENTNPDPPDVVVAGIIDNPIGTTRIVNPHGSILSMGSRMGDADPGSLIRTNVLDLEAPSGSVGQASARVNIDIVDSAGRPPDTNFITSAVSSADGSILLGPNEFFTGQLVKYHAGGAVLGNLTSDHYYVVIESADGQHIQLAEIATPSTPIAITPTASPTDSHVLTPAQRFTVIAGGDPSLGLGNAYLDVKARRRDDPGTHLSRPKLASDKAITDYEVIIDAVNTTGNADLRLEGSVTETDTTGTTYPGGMPGHAGGILVVYAGHPAPGERHFTYFVPPPSEPAVPKLDVGAFAFAGASATHINSTYDFRAYDAAGNLWRPGITAGRNIIITAADSNAPDPKIVNVYGITEILGGGSASSSDQHHIDVLTNGYITLHEKTDDLRVGSITSTGSPSMDEPRSGDVTLFAHAAIIDALNDGPGAGGDVTGRNITMTAGDNKITGVTANDQSGRGGIGTPGNFLEVNENANGAPLGVLNATDTASATKSYVTLSPPFDPAGTGTFGVFMTETAGDMEVDTVNTKGNVSLATVSGSIVDARKGGMGDDAANVIGNTINLFAKGGNIGDPSGNNDLEIDSQAYAYGTIGARATGSLHLTETLPTTLTSFAPDAQVVLMQALGIVGGDAVGGDARFTVREGPNAPPAALTPPLLPTAKGEDLNLLATGPVLFLENNPETLVHGLVNTPNGSILLRVGDNVNTDPNAQILAGHNIDIYGDFARVNEVSSGMAVSDTGDPGFGTVMQLHGVIAHGPTASGYLTRFFGNADTDQFFFDQTFLGGNSGTASSPIPGGGPSQIIPDGGFGVAGTMASYSGGKARAYGSNTPSPMIIDNAVPVNFVVNALGDQIQRTDGGNWVGDGFSMGDIISVNAGPGDPNNRNYTVIAVTPMTLTLASRNLVTPESRTATVQDNKVAPAGDGEDYFVVNQLQSMVINQETSAGEATDESLTLDGQSGSDTYVINTTGTHGDVRNYVINVLDSGAPDDGVDNVSVYGRDTFDPAFNGPNGSFDDIFLLRRTTGIAGETPTRPVLYADDSAFVAVLDFDPTKSTTALAQAQASDPSADGSVRSESVQRVNYDSAINGRLMVFGLGGNDYFAVDDNAATTTLDGGVGNDTFQIGQIYGLQRDGSTHSQLPLGNTFGGSVVAPYDQFPQLVNSLTPQSIYGTVATTRGWLSAGATSPLLAEGGSGDDSFTVYSNQATLRLEGDDGNDIFTVRAFALAQTDPITGDIVWIDPVQHIAQPRLTRGFSTAAETNIRTGAGSNQVEYNINAPVSVDGGPGFDKLVILGTEFADHIVVTDKAIYGAGLTVTYQNIEVLEIDALEGDDTIDVLSTPPGMAVRVIGGLGNDTINVAGDVAGDVVSRDINGTSSTITNRITSSDPAYNDLVSEGLSLSVARPNQGQVIIDENLAGDLSPGFTDVREGGIDDIYGIYLAHAPAPGTHVYVTVSAAMSPQEEHGNTGELTSGDIVDNTGVGDSILVALGNVGPGMLPAAAYDRVIFLNGTFLPVPARAVVVVFDDQHWDVAGSMFAGEQTVHVLAVDDSLAEGTRTVTISHSVLSDDPAFDHAIVRNVEVTVHDNDQPGIVVTQLDPSTPDATSKYGFAADNVTKVLEGDSVTEVTDLYALELENQPLSGTVRVAINPQDNRVSLSSMDPRFHTIQDPQPDGQTGMYYVDFNSGNWSNPVIITTHAVERGAIEDPHDTTIIQSVDGANTTDTAYKNASTPRSYPKVIFADSPTGDTITRTDLGGSFVADGFLAGETILISGSTSISHGLTNNAGFTIKSVSPSTLTLTAINTVIPTPAATTEPATISVTGGTIQRLDALVIDDGSAGVFFRESGGSTLVSAGTASQGPGKEDTYQMRLDSPPTANVNIDTITDGQTDIDPTQSSATKLTVTFARSGAGDAITRASGSWVKDGYVAGGTITISGTPGNNRTFTIKTVTASALTLTVANSVTNEGPEMATIGRVSLAQTGTLQVLPLFTGNITVAQVDAHTWTITRASGSETGSWVNDGFLPGQTIRIEGTGNPGVDNPNGFYKIGTSSSAISDLTITLTDAGGAILPTAQGTFNTDGSHTVTVELLNQRGVFTGNVEYTVATVPFLMFGGTVKITGGNTITRSDIGSFVNDNFAPGQWINVQLSNGSIMGGTGTSFQVVTVSTSQITVSGGLTNGTFTSVSINKLLDALRRTDGTSWLDSGFLEGQLVQFAGLPGQVTPMLEKIDLITGTASGKLDLMVLTDHPASPTGPVQYSGRPLGGPGTDLMGTGVSFVEMAARVTYARPAVLTNPDDTPMPNPLIWYNQVTVSLIADPYFDIQPGHQNLRAFPKVPHLLSGIRGPLSVEGGTTSEDRSIVPAVLLPGEANAAPFNIPPQPPETQSIDTLNVFNDGTKGNDTGTLTSTAITGLGMGPGLDFSAELGGAHPFGESGVYPGGISYGSISLVQDPNFPSDPSKQIFNTDASHSTLEVVNIFLGTGNDQFTVNSTLIPGPDHNADGTVAFVSEHGGITTVHGGGNTPLQLIANNPADYPFGNGFDTFAGPSNTGKLVRTDGLPWVNDGFAVGQQVLLSIDGGSVGTYTIIAIGDPNPVNHKPGSVLTLLAAPGSPALTTSAGHVTGTISVTDQLALVSGQVIGAQTIGNFDVLSDRVIRDDNLPWASLGFAVGQTVTVAIGGNLGTWTVVGFDNTASGLGSAVLLSGPALLPLTNTAGLVSVASRYLVTGPFTVTATALTRASGTWAADGFKKGQAVAIGGQPGYWLVSADPAGAVLKLQGADLTTLSSIPSVAIDRIGGDAITVNGTGEVVTGNFTVSAPVFSGLTPDPQGTTDRLTRSDGHTWNGTNAGDSAYSIGQQIALTGEWSFPMVVFARNTMGDTIMRTDGGNWLTDGFVAGETIQVSGTTSTNGNLTNNGAFTIQGVTATTLTLTAANTVVPTVGTEPMTVELTPNFLVTGFANSGTTLLVQGLPGQNLPRQAAVPMTIVVDAPLVVYGDTTQDGVWYNGKSYQTQSLGKFNTKPQPHMDSASFTMATPSVGQTNPVVTLSVTLATYSTADGTFGTITRGSGDWTLDNFLVNGLVTIDGQAVGEILTLSPTTLTLQNLTPAFATFASGSHTIKEWASGSVKLASGQFDPGFVPEGLITLGATYNSVVLARDGAGDTITRMDGGSWLTDGFTAGQTIAVSGTTYNNVNFTLVSVTASTLRVSVSNSVIPTPTGTTESARVTADIGTVAEIGTQYNITFSSPGGISTITRNGGGSWLTDGFAAGQNIAIYGTGPGGAGLNNQLYKILNVTATTLIVDKPVTAEGPENAVISGGGAKRDTLYLIDLQPAFLTLLGGSASVTLQRTIVQRNRLGQNADFFVFPLANQYTFDGNDVLDAHSLFVGIPNGLLPAVGLTMYGGKGDDTLIGSATGDHLAGGSGNDLIIGGRGVDHLYGDSGINVDVITRVLTVAQTAGNSGATNLDPLFAGNDVIYGDAPGSTATDVYGDYNDVVFGDKGDVGQAVSGARDTTKSLPLVPQRIETTLLSRTIVSQSRQVGADDTIYGNGGDDVLIGGTGNDAIDGGGDRDLIFGDNVSLSRSGHLGNLSNLRFETLQGTQIYSTGPTTAGQDLASKVAQADPRGHGAWGDYVITLFDHGENTSLAPIGSYGNDYIAGGPADDMIFGEMGNDTVQGDGSIDYVSHVMKDNGSGQMVADPTYPIGGRVGVINVAANYAGNPFRDATNSLVVRPSFDAATDGQDYIEGGGGNDILFGNQGQDDLVGGSSDMFNLATRAQRPDGSDLIFGGSGTQIARSAIGDATIDAAGNITTTSNGHANDSDAIIGDNGDIIRLIGVNSTVAPPVGAAVVSGSLGQAGNPVQSLNGLLRYNYDNYNDGAGAAKIVVRDVRQLDYSPGGVTIGPLYTVTFAASAGGDTITRSSGSWLADGDAKGQTITVFGTASNDGDYLVTGVTAGTLTLSVANVLKPTPVGSTESAQIIADNGAADEIHGENGDDFIYGGKGADWLYGDGQSDDIIGGYGNDWISGGTGDDGIIGDDGRIYTSRNSLSADPTNPGYLVSQGEPLNGVAPLLQADADPKYSNGNALNEFIFTPGNMQIDTINVSGALKKTIDLTPFSVDPAWNAQGAQPSGDETAFKGYNDDIIYGGLGNDWLHGGSGDDAISGAEALWGGDTASKSYTQTQDVNLNLTGIAETDYSHPFNPGDALRFNPIDPNSKHPHIAGRTGEFALYDENNPMREVLLNPDGTLSQTGSGLQFFLNFNQDDGVFIPGGTAQQNGNQTVTYGPVHSDGNDNIFGDNGNDWIVGGTGRDHMYGGWGNDLLDADDNLTTYYGLNTIPETAPTYEDRAYGGAGKDVLIANTGGDRLIDWVGEYNSYLVPFSEFGMATVSRTLQPQLHFFLYAESLSDGVDATRFSDLNGGAAPPSPKNNDPNPGRNGEPAGELGLVLQQDAAWHTQTGAPTDPQAGNTPGTQRDVLRSANFSGNGPSALFVAAGTWNVTGGAYQNTTSTVSGDNVSLFDLNTWLPSYYEVQSTLKIYSGGSLANAFVIFDYQGANDFKYAGLDATNNLLKIGQRTATGWVDLATLSGGKPAIGLNQNNTMLLAVNGNVATLTFGKLTLSYTFTGLLNTGLLGVGTNSSLAAFSTYTVQKLPITFTYQVSEDFSDGVADKFTPQTGTWTTTSGTSGRYYATPPASDAALSVRPLAVAPLSYVEYSATVNASKAGVYAGLAFDVTSSNDFLYAAVVAGASTVVLGHRSNGIWNIDATASANIAAGSDYTLLVALTEETTNNVNVVLNGKTVISFNYNYLVHDGSVGLLARNGNASFDNVLIRGDDVAYAGGGTPQLVAAAAPAGPVASLSGAQLSFIIAAAIRRWAAVPGVNASLLQQASFVVADLPDGMIGQTVGNSIVIDPTAAGWGWYVDVTPLDDSEFSTQNGPYELAAKAAGPALGRMDLLTVVMHELGHLAGRDDVPSAASAHDLMTVDLAVGVRRLPSFVVTPFIGPGDGAGRPASSAINLATTSAVATLQVSATVSRGTNPAPVNSSIGRGAIDGAFAAGLRDPGLGVLLGNDGSWKLLLDQAPATEAARLLSIPPAYNLPRNDLRMIDPTPIPQNVPLHAAFVDWFDNGPLAVDLSKNDMRQGLAGYDPFVAEMAGFRGKTKV
jgi:hypothetical protein